MNSLSSTKIKLKITERIASWPEWFMVFAGGILAFDGTAKLLAVLEKSQQLYLSDPIIGIQFHYLFIMSGIIELLVAYLLALPLCLFTIKRKLALGLMAWLATNLIVYRIGLWSMGWYHPYPWLAEWV